MAERRQDPADDEGRLAGVEVEQAVLEVVGEPHRVVEDVLRRGEPEPDDRRVDDPVEHPVELVAKAPEDDEEDESLRRLLHDRGADRRGVELPDRLAEALGHDQCADGVDDDRDEHRDARAPQERQRDHPAGLALVAVDVERERQVDRDRQVRDAEAEHVGDRVRVIAADQQRERPEEPEQDQRPDLEAARDHAVGRGQGGRAGRPGRWPQQRGVGDLGGAVADLAVRGRRPLHLHAARRVVGRQLEHGVADPQPLVAAQLDGSVDALAVDPRAVRGAQVREHHAPAGLERQLRMGAGGLGIVQLEVGLAAAADPEPGARAEAHDLAGVGTRGDRQTHAA